VRRDGVTVSGPPSALSQNIGGWSAAGAYFTDASLDTDQGTWIVPATGTYRISFGCNIGINSSLPAGPLGAGHDPIFQIWDATAEGRVASGRVPVLDVAINNGDDSSVTARAVVSGQVIIDRTVTLIEGRLIRVQYLHDQSATSLDLSDCYWSVTERG